MKKGYYLLPAFFIVMIFVFQFCLSVNKNQNLILAFLDNTGVVKNSSTINAVEIDDPESGATELDLVFDFYGEYLRVKEANTLRECTEIKCEMPNGKTMNIVEGYCKIELPLSSLASDTYSINCYIEDSAGNKEIEETVHLVVKEDKTTCIQENDTTCALETATDPNSDPTPLDLVFDFYGEDYLRVKEANGLRECTEIKCEMPNDQIMNIIEGYCKIEFHLIPLGSGTYPINCYIEDSAGNKEVEETVHVVVKEDKTVCIQENDTTCALETTIEEPIQLDLKIDIINGSKVIAKELNDQMPCTEIRCILSNDKTLFPQEPYCALYFDFNTLAKTESHSLDCRIINGTELEAQKIVNIVVNQDETICIENGTTCKVNLDIVEEEPDDTEPDYSSEDPTEQITNDPDESYSNNDLENDSESDHTPIIAQPILSFSINKELKLLTVRDAGGIIPCSKISCNILPSSTILHPDPIQDCGLRFNFGTLEPGTHNVHCNIEATTDNEGAVDNINIVVKGDRTFCLESEECTFQIITEEPEESPEEDPTNTASPPEEETITNPENTINNTDITDYIDLEINLTSEINPENEYGYTIYLRTNKRSSKTCTIQGSAINLTETDKNLFSTYFDFSGRESGTYHIECTASDGLKRVTKTLDINIVKPTEEENRIAENIEKEEIFKDKCESFGIEDKEECQKYLLDIYTNKVLEINTNEKITEEEAKNTVNKNIIEIMKLQTRNEVINLNSSRILEKNLEAGEIEEEINKNNEAERIILPISEKQIRITTLKAKEDIKIEGEEIIQSTPIILIMDNDGDGIPNDIEIRIGTDPENADTDGDGYNDGEEIRANYNPLGEGKKETKLSTIEKAIINKREIEHPKTNGEVKENFTVEIENNEEKKGYKLSGKAEANSTITLYIYSDIPVVTTVTTDEYGNWQYEFAESLEDGEHEIYISLNDDTGKVVSKSNPLSFMVKEAKAVSASEIADIKETFDGNEDSKDMMIYYLIMAGVGIAAGISMFLFLLFSKKVKQN